MLMKPDQFELQVSTGAQRHERRKNPLMAAIEWLEAYAEHKRQQRALLSLNDHLLKDIGISRCDAERIARKPFSSNIRSQNGFR